MLLASESALRIYLRLDSNPELEPFDDDSDDDDSDATDACPFEELAEGASIWHPFPDSTDFHRTLWDLLGNECEQFAKSAGSADPLAFAHLLLDLGQGLRKILLRLDSLKDVARADGERPGAAVARMLARSTETRLLSPWLRMIEFLRVLHKAQGSIRRPQRHSSRRQSLWKGVYLRDEEIVSELHGDVKTETRISRCAAFNSPLLPDILVCTAIGSEGIDLHLNCDEIIHHDLPWNPARFEQRTGRLDRVGSLADRLYRQDSRVHRLDIGVPFLAFDYDEFRFKTLLSRAQKFEVLLGKPEFTLDVDELLDDPENSDPALPNTDEATLPALQKPVATLPRDLIDLVRIDLSVALK
ncbi:C-terminal helicase domain-containing protein [Candidatus Accumulibacter sp. ACC003]|uniref:C-terminal helicase domain-containing protein n=1 Tax=Candidatus Accumulibacter sp. ACC003 TaxID=2823334 RepID=UPI0025C6A47D|nr:C-terminal helicase domain-containing protein [Candidatus Accumulibacter sp. ACC003]